MRPIARPPVGGPYRCLSSQDSLGGLTYGDTVVTPDGVHVTVSRLNADGTVDLDRDGFVYAVCVDPTTPTRLADN